MFVIYVDIFKEACREVVTIFREGPIEGFWHAIGQLFRERGNFSEKEGSRG